MIVLLHDAGTHAEMNDLVEEALTIDTSTKTWNSIITS